MTVIDINPALSRTLSAEHECLAAQIKDIEHIMGEPQYEAHTMLVALRKLIDLAQENFAHEEESMIDARLIPLTQVHLYVVAWRCRRSDFCSGFRAR